MSTSRKTRGHYQRITASSLNTTHSVERLGHIGTLVQNETESADKHHLLFTGPGATAHDRAPDDRLNHQKKWRHKEFTRNRKEVAQKVKNEIIERQQRSAKAAAEAKRHEEERLRESKRQAELKRKEQWQVKEARILGLIGGAADAALLRQRLASAAYTDGGVSWDKLFKLFDRDNNGVLTFEEFNRSLRREWRIGSSGNTDSFEESLPENKSKEDITKNISGLSSSNKTIEKDISISEECMHALFEFVDANGDGVVSLDEFWCWLEYSKDPLGRRNALGLADEDKIANNSSEKANILGPEAEAALEHTKGLKFVETDFNASATMKITTAKSNVHYFPERDGMDISHSKDPRHHGDMGGRESLQAWYHKPGNSYVDSMDSSQTSEEDASMRIIENEGREARRAESIVEKKKMVNKKKRKKKSLRRKKKGRKKKPIKVFDPLSSTTPPQHGAVSITADEYEGDKIWLQRRRKALSSLDRWCTATIYLTRESRKRKIIGFEKLRNNATSQILRLGLRTRVERLEQNSTIRSAPVYLIMCAITLQRAWVCSKKRHARASARKIQARWREHLWCVEIIRRSLKRIELRIQRGALNAWNAYYWKRRRARDFLRKHLMSQKERCLSCWRAQTILQIEDRERKRVAGTAKFLKRQLYKTFHALLLHCEKCKRVKSFARRKIAGIKGNMFRNWIYFKQKSQGAKKCCHTIQWWWRSLPIIVKRRYIIRTRRRHATIDLQRYWRGCYVRVSLASRKIQCRWRIFLAKACVVDTEFQYRVHERLRGIAERFVSQKSFRIDGPRIAGEFMGRGEYLSNGGSIGFSRKSRRIRARKTKILKAVAMHLQHSYYLRGVARFRSHGGTKYALDHSVGLAFDLFDPHLDGKVPVALVRNILVQLLGRKHELSGSKNSMKVGHNLDRDQSGYVDRETFIAWYKNTVGTDIGRPRIELALSKDEEAIGALGLTFGEPSKLDAVQYSQPKPKVNISTEQISSNTKKRVERSPGALPSVERIQGADAMTSERRQSWIGRQMKNSLKRGGRAISFRSRVSAEHQINNNTALKSQLNSDTMLIPAAEVAFFEAVKWIIRDIATTMYRTSGVAVGENGKPIPVEDVFTQSEEIKAREAAAKEHARTSHKIALPSETDEALERFLGEKRRKFMRGLRQTTMPKWIGSKALNKMTFGTYAEMREFEKRLIKKDKEAVSRLKSEKCVPGAGTTVRTVYEWLKDKSGQLQQEIRKTLIEMEKAKSAPTNKEKLQGESEKDYLKRLRANRRSGERGEYATEAARIAAELRAKREKEEQLLASLGGPGTRHELKDHRAPVVFKLKSFSKEHKYRAKWSSVDHRIGRKGKKMPKYSGMQYASKTNAKGFCIVKFNLPRVGIYRVDIEQCHAVSRSEALHDLAKGHGKKDSEDAGNCADEVGRVATKLRQVVEKSRWEAIAGSPKFINAKFSVRAYTRERETLAEKERIKEEAKNVKLIASHFGETDLTTLLKLPERASLRETEHQRFAL